MRAEEAGKPGPMPADSAEILSRALEALDGELLVVVTGAGISLASGIPTFRGTDPDAVWKRDVTELGTFQYFCTDPVGSWQWYTSRFDGVLDKQPNDAHRALVAIERWQVARGGRFLLVTQNVDTLHEDAGSKSMVKVHGSADRVRCTTMGCVNGAPDGSLLRAEIDMQPFFYDPSRKTLPVCPVCRRILRQHVLWFDEFYDGHSGYQWPSVVQAASTMGLGLFVGTSFSVGVTDMFVQSGLQAEIPLYAVDPGADAPPYRGIELLRERSEDLLPAVCARLGVSI